MADNFENILIVDDDKLDRKLLVRAFQSINENLIIQEAWDEESTESKLENSDFDCVFLDYNLGTTNGLTLLETIQNKKLTNAPMIILSGYNDSAVMIDCLRAGAQDYLLKNEISGVTLTRSIRHARERIALNYQLRYLAEHDQLTGLANRQTFLTSVSSAISRAIRYNRHFALLFLDLDAFKDVNDTYGHDAGDALLKKVGERMHTSVRASDVVGRFGGDEFAILLEDLDTKEMIIDIAESTLRNIGHAFTINENPIQITPSIGIALYPDDGESADDLIRCADMAMYHAKNAGKNQVSFFADEMHQKALVLARTKVELKQALEQKQFELKYQPQVEIETGRLVGVEALIRWNHPTRGKLDADEFITLAEKTGQIIPIGEWVLSVACKQLEDWADQGLIDDREFSLSVNITADQLKKGGSSSILQKYIEKDTFQNHRLVLELTETMLIDDIEHCSQALAALSNQGIGVAIDDFGTEFASFRHLLLLPLSYLKIDKIFVDKIATDKKNADIVRGIVAMAKALHLHVIAEGVEQHPQQDTLLECGCERLQGFLYSRPIAPQQVNELLQQKTLRVSA